MDNTSAERQRRYRERRQQNHQALLDELAALRARVAQLEAELAGRPQPAPRTAPGRQQDAALRRERDELAERLSRIVAYDPKIEAKAQAWIKRIDRTPRR